MKKFVGLFSAIISVLIFSNIVLAQQFDFRTEIANFLTGYVLPSNAVVTKEVLTWPNIIYFYFVPLAMFGVFMYDLMSVATWPRGENSRKAFAALIVLLMVPSGLAITVASYLYGIGFFVAYLIGGLALLFTVFGFAWRKIRGAFSTKGLKSGAESEIKEAHTLEKEAPVLGEEMDKLDREMISLRQKIDSTTSKPAREAFTAEYVQLMEKRNALKARMESLKE